MKIGRESTEITLGGQASAPQAFRIAASREAFDTLSSGLYNNQIGAIIRELSCNAYDSHVAANKQNTPFTIHLPNRFEPFFSIEDYGIGLSEEGVYDLYTTYFGTNKTDSNDFIGALGLGSKSPFCYTEGFSIVSTYNGVRTTYGCYLDENGPAVQKQISVPHIDEDEPFFAQSMNNGVKVSFPVKMQDCEEFKNNANKMLEFFDPLPECNEKLNVKKSNYILKTESWGVRKKDGPYDSSQVRAIQGKVVYSVGTIDKSKLSYEEQQLLNEKLDLFFPIGELSVAASRETLKNDERTVQNILNRIKGISETYAEQIKAQLSEKKTLWEAMIAIKGITSGEAQMSNLLKREFNKGFFDGDYSFGHISKGKECVSVAELDYRDVTVHKFHRTGYSRTTDSEKSHQFHPVEKLDEIEERIKKGEADRNYYRFSVDPSDHILFVVGDIPFGAEKFIHHYLQRSGENITAQGKQINQVYLISRSRKEISVERVKAEALRMIKELGNPPVMYLSDLKAKYWPEMKTEKEDQNRGIIIFNTRYTISRYGDGGYERKGWRDGWSINVPVDHTTGKFMVPKDEKKYYVVTKKGEVVGHDFSFAEEFRQFVIAVSDAGILSDFNHEKIKLYGMSENSQFAKDAKNDPMWVEFTQEVFTELLKMMTPELEMKLSLQVKNFEVRELNEAFTAFAEKLPPTSPMKMFVDALKDARSIKTEKAQAIARIIAEASKVGKYELKHVTDFNQKWGEMMKRYPLLGMINYRRHYHDAKDTMAAMVDYVEMVDQKREFEDLINSANQNAQLLLDQTTLDVTTQEKENTNDNEESKEAQETRTETTGSTTGSVYPQEEQVCSSDVA